MASKLGLRQRLRDKVDRHRSSSPSTIQALSSTTPLSADSPNNPEVALATKPGLPSVQLEPIFTKDQDSRLAEAQQKLQDASEKLESILQSIASSSNQYLPDLQQKLEDASTNPSNNLFESVIEQTLSVQNAKRESVGGKASEFMTKLFPILKLVLSVTSSVGSAAGYMPVAMTANGLNQVLSLLSNTSERKDDIESGLETLHEHQHFVSRIRELPAHTLDKAIVRAATNLLTANTNFLRISLMFLKRNYFINFANCAIGGDQVVATKSELKRACEELDREVDRAANLIILKRQNKEDKTRLLGQMSSLDYDGIHSDVQQRRHADTGNWFLEDDTYTQWRNGNFRALWCPGLPGAGKTFVASTLIDDLRTQSSLSGAAVVFLYCNYKNYAGQNTYAFRCEIAKQLVRQRDELAPEAEKLWKEHDKPTTAAVTSFLTEAIKHFSRIFVVVDALDEFSNHFTERENLSLALGTLTDQTSTGLGYYSICITSREADEIFDILNNKQGARRITVRPSDGDIRQFTQESMNANGRIRKVLASSKDAEFLRKIEDIVIEKSDRM